MTLDDIKKEMHDARHPANAPAVEPLPDLVDRPWWVVVVNPRRQPPQPKLYFSYAAKDEADAVCENRQAEADEQAKRETAIRKADAVNKHLPDPGEWKPFRYFVVERPEGGVL